ncbi:MAG: type IV pilus modification PilV family protein [Methylobacter sp.]
MGNRQSGISLIELVIFMVIVGVAMAGIIASINYNVQHSADPVVRKQALAIAEALLEEVMLQNFSDPDGPPNVVEASRDLYDDIDDYNNYSRNGISSVDAPAATIAGLENYSVSVLVDSAANLNGITGGKAKRIAVTVTGPLNTSVLLEGYRTDYGL